MLKNRLMIFGHILIKFSKMVDAGEVETGVKFKLMITRFHIFAEFVKGFVVLFLYEVGQFMDDDHTQKGFW